MLDKDQGVRSTVNKEIVFLVLHNRTDDVISDRRCLVKVDDKDKQVTTAAKHRNLVCIAVTVFGIQLSMHLLWCLMHLVNRFIILRGPLCRKPHLIVLYQPNSYLHGWLECTTSTLPHLDPKSFFWSLIQDCIVWHKPIQPLFHSVKI